MFIPLTRLKLVGDTTIEFKAAPVIVKLVLPDKAPELALINDEPVSIPLANPELFTVATKVSADDQVTEAVILASEPSE